MIQYKIGDHVKYLYTLGRPQYNDKEYRTGVIVDYDEEFSMVGNAYGPIYVGIRTGKFLVQRSNREEFSINIVPPDWIEELLSPVEDPENYPTI